MGWYRTGEFKYANILQWQLGAQVSNLIPMPNYVSDYNISWQFMVSPLMMQLLSKFFVDLLELKSLSMTRVAPIITLLPY